MSRERASPCAPCPPPTTNGWPSCRRGLPWRFLPSRERVKTAGSRFACLSPSQDGCVGRAWMGRESSSRPPAPSTPARERTSPPSTWPSRGRPSGERDGRMATGSACRPLPRPPPGLARTLSPGALPRLPPCKSPSPPWTWPRFLWRGTTASAWRRFASRRTPCRARFPPRAASCRGFRTKRRNWRRSVGRSSVVWRRRPKPARRR